MRVLICLVLLLAFSADAEVLLYEQDNGLKVSAALDAAVLVSQQNNSFYLDSPDEDKKPKKTRNRDFSFSEYAIHPQLYLSHGDFYAGLSAIGAATRGDGEPSSFDASDLDAKKHTEGVDLEFAYIGWKSGKVDLSVGAQIFEVADGLMIADGNGDPNAVWLAPQNAFKQTAIARFDFGSIKPTLFYLRADHEAQASAELGGVDLAFSDEAFGEFNLYGFRIFDAAFNFDDSVKNDRKGLNVYAVRYDGNPIAAVENLNFAASAVLQRNGSDERKKRALGWYAEVGYDFEVVRTFLRRSQFSGDKSTTDKSEEFDQLFTGINDFGAWFPGEIVGNQIRANNNLRIWTLGLRKDLELLEGVTLGVNLYRFDYDVKVAGGEDHLGDEIDLFAEIQATENLSLTPIVAMLQPGDGAEKIHGKNSDTATLLALIASVSF